MRRRRRDIEMPAMLFYYAIGSWELFSSPPSIVPSRFGGDASDYFYLILYYFMCDCLMDVFLTTRTGSDSPVLLGRTAPMDL